MVNFGGHIKAVQEGETKGTDLYLIPYNGIKVLIDQSTPQQFCEKWKEALKAASDDLTAAFQHLWSRAFDSSRERGAKLTAALSAYVQENCTETARLLLNDMTHIHTAALTNTEGLRKLVKKHDKHHQQPLSPTLLPILYASNLLGGQALLVDSIEVVRTLLYAKEAEQTKQPAAVVVPDSDEEDNDGFLPLSRENSEFEHRKTVIDRLEELEWLKRMIQSTDTLLPCLVAHRGFHHIQDRNDRRPLENSLAAYEMAWTSGIHLCECDIALTKDGKLVLAHDDDFQRLALDSRMENSTKRVSDLTFKELISLPLKSGLRPPLLMDVLRSAHAISDHARLIIEIKPGNQAAATALARLLWKHADLADRVEMIMSFDAVTMHRLRREFAATDDVLLAPPLNSHHRRFQSVDHFGTLLNAPSERSRSLSSVGLSLSQANLSHVNLVDDTIRPHEFVNTTTAATRSFPKLMLLTVAQPPKRSCELRVGVHDLSPVEGWLRAADGSLDGVYLQYESNMMTEHGAAALHQLSRHFWIGVWGYSGVDPDNWETMDWLVQRGSVRYVNTDLPYTFRKDIALPRSSSTVSK